MRLGGGGIGEAPDGRESGRKAAGKAMGAPGNPIGPGSQPGVDGATWAPAPVGCEPSPGRCASGIRALAWLRCRAYCFIASLTR